MKGDVDVIVFLTDIQMQPVMAT